MITAIVQLRRTCPVPNTIAMHVALQLTLPFDDHPSSGAANGTSIYTLGYAGWAPADLRDEVLRLGVTLIDVRIVPTSKSPQWRKEALAALLGPRYTHLPALGNRNAFSDGRAVLADPERALGPVAALLADGPVALLCCPETRKLAKSVC